MSHLGSYEKLYPEYYSSDQPDGPFRTGAPGWAEAPWVTWGQNPNQAGPRRIATDGLGSVQQVATRCDCQVKPVGEEKKFVCNCAPPPPPPPRPPFWQSEPHWFFRQYVRDRVAPWGTLRPRGPAFDVPRRQICPTCSGSREPTSGLGALGAVEWGAVPWWCWTNADGKPNQAFTSCKDAALARLLATTPNATEAQRVQYQMDACYTQCRTRPPNQKWPTVGNRAPGEPTSVYSPVPASVAPKLPQPSSSWSSMLPRMNTTTWVILALVGVAGVVVAQQKGWL